MEAFIMCQALGEGRQTDNITDSFLAPRFSDQKLKSVEVVSHPCSHSQLLEFQDLYLGPRDSGHCTILQTHPD